MNLPKTEEQGMPKKDKRKYLVALPCWAGAKGFNHQVVLVSAYDVEDAKDFVRHLKGERIIIGDIKEVDS